MAGTSKLVIDLRDADVGYVPTDEASLGSLVARTVIPKLNNLFLLGFGMEEDKKHVLKGSPWLVSHLHLSLKPWNQEMILSQIPLKLSHFLIQLHDIPPNLLSHQKIVKIGDAFPVFLLYEPSLESVLGWQEFIRGRIEFDVSEFEVIPSVHGLDTNGKEIWIKFKPNEGVKLPEETSYSPWMRAKEIYGKYYSRKRSLEKGNAVNAGDGDKNKQGSDSAEATAFTSPTKPTKPGALVQAAREQHTEIVNTVAAIVEESDERTPVHASASKPEGLLALLRYIIVLPRRSWSEIMKCHNGLKRMGLMMIKAGMQEGFCRIPPCNSQVKDGARLAD
ncbi:hypothetical protein Tsubulata_003555 [Turnera subulata]|uniref:DUF4283 domain-containing protein n=1 Tax=Turnera subulata TaxID=218843 RepID=A0A9Q0JL32_9ROSI|nr:hypothetical protein Tsubulata_003555 [Turnera subulata]